MPKTNSRLVLGFFLMLILAGPMLLQAAPLAKPGVNNCSLHDPMDESVPLCPESGQVLTASYPAAAVTIAESFSLEGDYPSDHPVANAGYDRFQLLAKTVENILVGQPGKPPQIFLNGTPGTKKKLIELLVAKKVGTRESLATAISLTPDMVTGRSWTWQQDIMQDGFDPETGRPVLREIVPYHSRGTRRHVRSTIATVKKECGLVTGGGITGSGPSVSGYAGGNIEPLPGGLCMVGTDSIAPDFKDEFFKSACGSLNSVVPIETSLLSPGHVDEMLTVVPDKTAPEGCQFAILSASPAAAVEAFDNYPDEPAFAFPGLTKSETENRIRTNLSWLRACSNFKNHYHGPSPGKTKPVRTSVGISFLSKAAAQSAASFLDDEEKRYERALKRLRDGLKKNDVFESRLPESYFRFDCTEMTNRQLVESFMKPELGREPVYGFNLDFQEVMVHNERRVYERLAEKFPKCKPKLLRVPQLVFGQVVEFMGRNVSVPGTGAALNPAPTNGIVIGDRYVMPDPMNEAMRVYNRKLFEKIGLKLEFLDTSSLSSTYGNLHCATNVVRYCRPRGAK